MKTIAGCLILAIGLPLFVMAQEKPEKKIEKPRKTEFKISRGKGSEIVNVVVDISGDHSMVKVDREEGQAGAVVIDAFANDAVDWIELKLLNVETLKVEGMIIQTLESTDKSFVSKMERQRFVLKSGPPLQQTHRSLVFRGEMTWNKTEGFLFHQFIDAEKKTKRVWQLEAPAK